MVEAHVVQHREAALRKRMEQARRRAQAKLRAAWDERIGPDAARLVALKAQVTEVLSRYQPRLLTLQEELSSGFAGFREELAALRQAVEEDIGAMTVTFPNPPEPKVRPDQGDGCWIVHATTWSNSSSTNYATRSKALTARHTFARRRRHVLAAQVSCEFA